MTVHFIDASYDVSVLIGVNGRNQIPLSNCGLATVVKVGPAKSTVKTSTGMARLQKNCMTALTDFYDLLSTSAFLVPVMDFTRVLFLATPGLEENKMETKGTVTYTHADRNFSKVGMTTKGFVRENAAEAQGRECILPL